MATQRSYGGVPAEQRRAARRSALLAAGRDLVGTDGAARVTVAGLCARAGLNERYFYESFGSCDEVVLAVYDSVIAEVTEAIVAAVAAAPSGTRATARAAIAAAVELLTDDPRLSRIVFVEPLATAALAGRRTATGRAFVALIVGQAQDHFGTATTDRLGSWAEFAAAHLLGGLAETMTAWLRGDLDITRDELVDRSTELFVLVAEYLTTA